MLEKRKYMMQIDEIIYKKNFFPSLNIKNKGYTTKRCEEVLDLLIECEKRSILLLTDKHEIPVIKEKIKDYLKNFQNIRELRDNLIKMHEIMNEKNSTKIKFRKYNTNFIFLRRHISTELGILYSSLCEVIKGLLCTIINFNKDIYGIGSLKKQLDDEQLPHDFFKDIDTDIRNAFSHLDYHLDVYTEIYYIGKMKKKVTFEELKEKSFYLDKISFAIQTVVLIIISDLYPESSENENLDKDYLRLKPPK